jgi:hypothetical protein
MVDAAMRQRQRFCDWQSLPWSLLVPVKDFAAGPKKSRRRSDHFGADWKS